MIVYSRCGIILLAIGCFHVSLPSPGQVVDASTLTAKTLVGYQGWFMAPGDGNPASVGWRHWSADTTDVGPGLYTVEMWPDLSEYDSDPGATIHLEPGASTETFAGGAAISGPLTLLNDSPGSGVVEIGAPPPKRTRL